jgi:hypothetical protein
LIDFLGADFLGAGAAVLVAVLVVERGILLDIPCVLSSGCLEVST